MNPETMNLVARAAEALNWPTRGYFASWLWRKVSSGLYADWETRKALSRAAGYIPFVGYPLTRSGKIDTMSRAEVERELTENPLCRMDAEGRTEP
jgi:hypothetical protein